MVQQIIFYHHLVEELNYGNVTLQPVQKFSNHTSCRRNRNIPFFLGPLQMIASSGLESRNPMDITDKLSSTYCKKHMTHMRTAFR
jgi:hypothetical protein